MIDDAASALLIQQAQESCPIYTAGSGASASFPTLTPWHPVHQAETEEAAETKNKKRMEMERPNQDTNRGKWPRKHPNKQWITHLTMKGYPQVCKDFSNKVGCKVTGRCPHGAHICAVRMTDNTICGQAHSALDHGRTR